MESSSSPEGGPGGPCLALACLDVMELAGRLARKHAQDLKNLLRLPGEEANQARIQLQALAQALYDILSTSTTSGGREERGSDGAMAVTEEEGGEPSSVEVRCGRGGHVLLLKSGRPFDYLVSHIVTARMNSNEPLVCTLARQVAGPGGVASGSGGEAPDPASPRGEGNKRARTTTSTSTSTSTTTISPPRPLITARHASRTAVVSSPELLEHVLTFLAGGKLEARRDLGRAALVCRSWREAAEGEEVWGRVASEAMPAMGRRVLEVGARRCVVERGHSMRDQRVWVGDTWWSGLRLQVEVWDELDGMCLLSAEGEMSITHHPHQLHLFGADRVEVVGPAFSAASRGPVQRRFASIDDYFRRGPEGTVEAEFRVRVYVRDEWRGRQALLWGLQYEDELQCFGVHPGDPVRAHLPDGSRFVQQAAHLPLYSPSLPGQALQALVGFYVRPEAGQEGVAEADKMWRMAGGDQDKYGDHDSFFGLHFHEDVAEAQIVSLIRGLLDPWWSLHAFMPCAFMPCASIVVPPA
jgi:hypothetical protein